VPSFRYEAVDTAGRSRRGILDAASSRAARDALRTDGLFPTAIETSAGAIRARTESTRLSTMLLALGMAVVMSATTDTVTTKAQRVGEQSFFVADAGIGIARRAIEQALSEEINKIRNATS